MSRAEQDFQRDRDLRNAARGLFDARLAQVKADLAARSPTDRIADKAKGDAMAVAREAAAVARDSKGIIAGTIAALVLWFLRRPIIAGLSSLVQGAPESATANEEDDDSE